MQSRVVLVAFAVFDYLLCRTNNCGYGGLVGSWLKVAVSVDVVALRVAISSRYIHSVIIHWCVVLRLYGTL